MQHSNTSKPKDQAEETIELITHSHMRNRLSLSTFESPPPSPVTTTSSPTVKTILCHGKPMAMVRMLLGAGLTASIHHAFLTILQGHDGQEQFWIKNSSNTLSTLVHWLCTGSVSISLTQLMSAFSLKCMDKLTMMMCRVILLYPMTDLAVPVQQTLYCQTIKPFIQITRSYSDSPSGFVLEDSPYCHHGPSLASPNPHIHPCTECP